MVTKCSAVGCTTGHGNYIEKGVSLHKFPLEDNLKMKWIRCIKREDFVPGKSARFCSLHFTCNDFETEHLDSNIRRKRHLNARVKNSRESRFSKHFS